MLQLEIPLETVYATIELGDVLGIPILLNPAPVAPELDLERIRGIEFFMPNESELEHNASVGFQFTEVSELETNA